MTLEQFNKAWDYHLKMVENMKLGEEEVLARHDEFLYRASIEGLDILTSKRIDSLLNTTGVRHNGSK